MKQPALPTAPGLRSRTLPLLLLLPLFSACAPLRPPTVSGPDLTEQSTVAHEGEPSVAGEQLCEPAGRDVILGHDSCDRLYGGAWTCDCEPCCSCAELAACSAAEGEPPPRPEPGSGL